MIVGTGVTMLVASGGVASATTLRNGTEIVSAGGSVVGAVTMSGSSDLSVAKTTGVALTVSGFGAGDIVRLASFRAGAAENLSFVENAAKTSGTLTITDGTQKATITLFGQYVAAGFHLANDPAGGTAISYTAPPVAHAELAASHG
jgi:autotransporter passenger strand-loop-strand repeat protein